MPKSDDYWRKREEENIKRLMREDKNVSKEIEKRMQYALDNIKKEIDANFAGYAARENISIAEARKRANEMDIQAYARKAKKYVKEKDFSKEANYWLKIYNMTMRANRLELLKAQIGLELVTMTDDLDKYLKETLSEHARSEVERQAGILGESIGNNYTRVVKNVFTSSHFGATFSERIWQYQAELKVELDRLLTRMISQGGNPNVMARELRDKFGVAKAQAERLMRTESAHVQAGIQKDSYKAVEIEEYEFIAEPTACKICLALDGKVFEVDEMSSGMNAQPMHPNCRCSTAPFASSNWREEFFDTIEGRKTEEYNTSKASIARRNVTLKEINDKEWSDTFKDKTKKAYREFSEHGYELSSHVASRFAQRADLSVKEADDILSRSANYRQPDGRKVWFYDGHTFIKNANETEIVTYVYRKNAKTTWKEEGEDD